MRTDRRYVFDTNVLVSAILLPHSVARQAFDRALTAGTILISASTVDELDEVLRRPRFEKYVTEEERLEFLAALLNEAELVELPGQEGQMFADADPGNPRRDRAELATDLGGRVRLGVERVNMARTALHPQEDTVHVAAPAVCRRRCRLLLQAEERRQCQAQCGQTSDVQELSSR